MRVNEIGTRLIAHYEGFAAEYYDCPAGVPTVGYGHAGPLPEGFRTPLSQADALRLLRLDVERYADAVREVVTVPLNEHQFNALVSFTYNVGVGAFRRSTLLRKLNEGDYHAAADEFTRWTKAGGRELPGLVKRRAEERKLFLTPPPAPVPPLPPDPIP